MSAFSTYIELPIEVEVKFSKGMKGSRDRYGVPEEPDDPDELEIQSIETVSNTGSTVDITDLLTKAQMDTIEQEAWERLKDE